MKTKLNLLFRFLRMELRIAGRNAAYAIHR